MADPDRAEHYQYAENEPWEEDDIEHEESEYFSDMMQQDAPPPSTMIDTENVQAILSSLGLLRMSTVNLNN